MDHFEVFGLPRRLGIDAAQLQRAFYELSRRSHPDFHQAAPPERQAEILEASARLNTAYRVLRDPIARVEYLVRLQEALQEARASEQAGGLDVAARETLDGQRDRLAARYRDEEARLRGPLSEAWDRAGADTRAGVLAAFKDALATRAYLRTVIDDIDEALGEVGEGHVSHRRH